VRIEYDREADALYVYIDEQALNTGETARTVEIAPVRIYADVDA